MSPTPPDPVPAGDRSEPDTASPDRTVAESAWAECEAIIKRFEESWRGSARPKIESLVPLDHPHRTQLLAELVHVDLELRLRAGENARAEEYLARFPELAREVVAVELIAAEFSLRNRASSVSPEEFLTRFPQYREALSALLPSIPKGGTTRRTAGSPPESSDPPIIPGYEIEEQVGQGGMGVVFRARQPALDRTVAVKTLRSPAPETRARFRREAEAMARLDHPNIIPVYEVGEGRTATGELIPYYTMKWYSGGGLDSVPCGAGTDLAAHARVVETVARALHHAHQRGVLHRDLKPSNVLLDERGEPHVADFGLAGLFDPIAQPGGGKTASFRGSGMTPPTLLGTPAYMAPEQAQNPSRITTAADVYGLGALLYHMLTGRPPFKGDNPFATLQLVMDAIPEPPSVFNRDVSRDLDAICLKCLEKDPLKRYPSAEVMADDLARFLAGRPVLARPLSAWERAGRWLRRHPVLVGVGVVAFAALMTLFVYLASAGPRVGG